MAAPSLRVGEQLLWRVIGTVLTDWRQHGTPVRGFMDCVSALVILGPLFPLPPEAG